MKSKKPSPGRPPLLTPTLLKKIVASVRKGNYPSVVVRSYGIKPRTYRRWRSQARRQPNSIYGLLVAGLTEARAVFERDAVEEIRDGAKGDPAMLLKILACTAPERWGSHVAIIRDLQQQFDEMRRQLEEWRSAATS